MVGVDVGGTFGVGQFPPLALPNRTRFPGETGVTKDVTREKLKVKS